MADLLMVYIDRNDIKISLDHNVLRIKSPGSNVKNVPLGMIGQIIINADIEISTSIFAELLDRNINIIFFSGFGRNRIPAWIGPGLSTSVMIRLQQYELFADNNLRLAIAKWIIEYKLKNQTALLDKIKLLIDEPVVHIFKKGLDKNYLINLLEKTKQQIYDSLNNLDKSDTNDSLMGYEGVAASAWFNFISEAINESWGFKGRNKRPPKDPLNALFSLTYTIAMTELKTTVHERGLDPCIGFLHSPKPGRESLVLDLLEPLRPGADAFIIDILDNNMLKPEHFSYNKKYGCRLDKSGRSIYYTSWADWRLNWPEWNNKNNNSESEILKDSIISDVNYNGLRTCCRKLIEELIAFWSSISK